MRTAKTAIIRIRLLAPFGTLYATELTARLEAYFQEKLVAKLSHRATMIPQSFRRLQGVLRCVPGPRPHRRINPSLTISRC